MKLEKIGIKEFDNFAIKHKYGSFMQNSFWGKLKEKNGSKLFLNPKDYGIYSPKYKTLKNSRN